MLKKIITGIFALILTGTSIFGEDDLTLEKLEQLRSSKAISQEDYEFLKAELSGELKEKYSYSFFINRRLATNNLTVVYKNNRDYVKLGQIFDIVGFKNYTYENGVLEMFLGNTLERVVINFNNGTIEGLENRTQLNPEDYYKEDGYYIDLGLFRDIFTTELNIDRRNARLSILSKYSLPSEIEEMLDNTERQLREKNSHTQMYYTNHRELFNLGYLRVDFDKTFTKTDGEKDDDWEGRLEYQGSLLYGTFTTEYDAKDGKFDDFKLHYDDLPYNHYLELETERTSADEWESSILIEKDEGYYEEGKTFIIRENVPIGSRVELIYLGTTIEVQDDINGVVEFNNREIKEDRKYLLKIHRPDGFIETRIIETADDFNQQNKGEFQYRLYGTEVKNEHASDRNQLETEIFYGLTDNFTIGANYDKTPEEVPIFKGSDEYETKYIERAGAEFVYSNTFHFVPYTFDFRSEKIITDNVYDEEDTFEGIFQVKFNDLTLEYQESKYSEYYEDKKFREISADWDVFEFLSIDQAYQWREDWEEYEENGYNLDVELSHSFGRVLTTLEFERDIDNEKTYSANIYYSTLKNYGIRWNNSVSENGGDYETTLSLYNIAGRDGIDYTLEFSYDEKEKDKFTFKINVQLDNWFEVDMEAKDSGNYDISLGVDRIIDLKNITKPVDSMDTSRVRVRTFLDGNNNNQYDKGEAYLGNVEVEINGEKQITNSKKPIYFYNVPNDIIYEFKPVVRIPGYDVIGSDFSLKGQTGGDIYVDIPIKPFFNISGQLLIEGNPEENQDIYSGIVLTLKDSEGNIVENVMPDYLGFYDISQIPQGIYNLEISSFKDENIKELKEELKFEYQPNKGNTLIYDTILEDNKIERRK